MAATASGTLPPGPTAPRSIQLYRFMRRPVETMEACRNRYGDTFTLRLPGGAGELVVLSDPASIKLLFGADRGNRLPPGRTLVLEPVMGPRSVLLLEGEEHLRRRRLMLPQFHGERMRAYEEVILDVTEREIGSWPSGRPFRLHPRMQAITLEVILRAVFGVEDPERLDSLRVRLRRILKMTAAPAMQIAGLATRRLGRFGPYRSFQALLDETDALLADEIAERRGDPRLAGREDVLSLMVAARFDDGSEMSDSELRDQLMTLLLAGHETTATGLAWTFDLLFRAPEAMERVRSEAEAGEHAFIDAVATESRRLRPVVPNVGRELGTDMELGGYHLPAGTEAFPSIYLAHTREDTYPEPYAFRPERFLDGGPETYSWIPFGGGTRRCLGASFAQFEMRIVLREVARRMILRPASDSPERVVRRNVTLSPRGGTKAILTERR